LFCSFLRVIKVTHFALETNELFKAVIADGSNNEEVWGQSPQLPDANGGLRAKFSTLRWFFDAEATMRTVFQKKHFKAYFGLKFCLKHVFKWLKKVCWCVPKACAPKRVPLATPLGRENSLDADFAVFDAK